MALTPRLNGPPPSPRVGLIGDLLEEGWPSMDLVADMLAKEFANPQGREERIWFELEVIRPKMHRRFSKANRGVGFKADRLLNRFFDYPRFLRRHRADYDLFHIADHSYSQLAHELPANRTVVTCHDLDSFRCLWERNHAGRSRAFIAMTRRILSGLQKAAHVCCDSISTHDELRARGLMPAAKISVVRLGVHPAFLEQPGDEEKLLVDRLLAPASPAFSSSVDLLHVGSVIPRKRIDVLLQLFARLREIEPHVRLLQAGGNLTAPQQELAKRLRVADAIVILPFLTAEQLAAVYRRAALVLLPSEAEGFGFPVVEAMACGTPALVSDLPVLREVGGDAAEYVEVADNQRWTAKVSALLSERRNKPDLWEARRERCRQQAARFSWAETARQMTEVYRRVLEAVD